MKKLEKVALALFAFGQEWCEKHGLILVDTKYGIRTCMTANSCSLMKFTHPTAPASGIADTYEKKVSLGEEPENFDKEYLRLWYAKTRYVGDGKPPE